jgi:hypothetical protein
MARYADPAACPDCGGPIARGAASCPRCGLALTGQTAVELFWTLQRADELLAMLRAGSAPVGDVAPAAAPASAPAAAGEPAQPVPAVAHPARPARSRLSEVSVPRILLGLGALCLVVAGLVFMAVTWARLGVGGRTVVLLAATLAAGAASAWTRRRSLPAAAEALTVVTVALAALDAYGAVDAGWLGGLDGGAATVVVGLVVATVTVVLGLLHEVTADHVGRAEQLLFALGGGLVAAGALARTDRPSVVLAVATTALLALGYAARRARLRPGAWALLAVGLLTAVGLLAVGVHHLSTEPLTFAHTVLHGGTADLAVLGVLGVAAAALRDLPAVARTGAAVVGLGLLALALTGFVLDDGASRIGSTTAALAVLAAGGSLLATGPWRTALRLLALLATVLAVVVPLRLAAAGAHRFLDDHAWLAEPATTPAAGHTAPDRWVGLLVVPPLAVLALLATLAPTRRWLHDRLRVVAAAVLGTTAAAGYAAAAVVPTPLVVLTAVGGAASVALTLLSLRVGARTRPWAVGGAHLLGLAAAVVSYPSAALLLAGSLLWAASCAVVVLGRTSAAGAGDGWVRWSGTAVWVLLAVPTALAVRDWVSPVAAAVLVTAGATLAAVGVAAALRTRTAAEVATGLAAAAGALAAGAVTWVEPSGVAATWAGVAVALAAAAGARAVGFDAAAAPVPPATADARPSTAAPTLTPRVALVLAAAAGEVVALLSAVPAVVATVERVLAPAAWSRSWRDRLPSLADVPSGVGAPAQAALVAAVVGGLAALLLLVAGAPQTAESAHLARTEPSSRRILYGAGGGPVRLGWPTAAGVLCVLSWMFLPGRALVVAAAVVLAAATLLALPRLTGAPARRTPVAAAAVALALLASGTLAALPSQVLFVAATACATAALLWMTPRGQVAWAAPAAVLVGATALVSGGLAAGLPLAWSAAPVLVVTAAALLAGAVLRRTWATLELAFTVAAVGAAAIAVADAGPTALAAHLAVVGALAAGHGAAHPDRRPYAWAGSVLLAASTWVRLADADVTVVEAYTLPSALALVGLGAWRLRTDLGVTSQRALGTGLLLATVPSLPQVWTDPVSLRALLVGLGCLALVLAGAARHLAAPLVVGAAAGAVVVLAEVWPVIGSGPQWVPLTAAGLLLLVCGATWEARLRDLRRAGAYLTALR